MTRYQDLIAAMTRNTKYEKLDVVVTVAVQRDLREREKILSASGFSLQEELDHLIR